MTAPTLAALTAAERSTPHRSLNFDAYLAVVKCIARRDGDVDANHVRSYLSKHVPELVHYNAGIVYSWLLKTGRAEVVGFTPLGNTEHRAANRPAPVYRLTTTN